MKWNDNLFYGDYRFIEKRSITAHGFTEGFPGASRPAGPPRPDRVVLGELNERRYAL
jgi:hypothetical protein